MPVTPLADRRRRRGTARVVAMSPAGTELSVAGTGHERVQVTAWPDAAGASRASRALDRVLWQRIEIRGGAVTGVLAGTRHRRPVQVRVGAAAALGLLEAGVPTVASVAVTDEIQDRSAPNVDG